RRRGFDSRRPLFVRSSRYVFSNENSRAQASPPDASLRRPFDQRDRATPSRVEIVRQPLGTRYRVDRRTARGSPGAERSARAPAARERGDEREGPHPQSRGSRRWPAACEADNLYVGGCMLYWAEG